MRWPKYWSFSFSIIPSKEHPGLISFRMDWLGLLAVQGTQESSPTPQFKSIVLWTLWERERVGRFGRMALKHVYYHVWNESPVQVRCTILDAWGWCTGMTQRMVWGGRREEGSGWGTHVYLWWIHFDIWQNQYNIVKFKIKKKALILQCSAFFTVQLSHPYMTTGKTIALTRRTFVK